jgi:ABC-type multidrug transport system ATPase subunit
VQEIRDVIRSVARDGRIAILLIEQYYDFARSLADHYLVMERGEIVARGRGADMDQDGVRAPRSMIGPCTRPNRCRSPAGARGSRSISAGAARAPCSRRAGATVPSR